MCRVASKAASSDRPSSAKMDRERTLRNGQSVECSRALAGAPLAAEPYRQSSTLCQGRTVCAPHPHAKYSALIGLSVLVEVLIVWWLLAQGGTGGDAS